MASTAANYASRIIQRSLSSRQQPARALTSRPFSTSQQQLDYESPFASFFDNIRNGRTTTGLKDDEPIDPHPPKFLKCGIDEDALRFQATHYPLRPQAPYIQENEFKITLKVNMADIPLENEVEREMLLQLVGKRYHERTNRLMLTSNKFPSRIENKRYLVDILDRLVISAKKLAKHGDSYYDVVDEK
mmetsp:Transcript_4940/g.6688  ORF Transcript_4940/g.6688 Transcript_4940/m.6688 type:complete len:188 (-) Transcript_4940:78-641(-)